MNEIPFRPFVIGVAGGSGSGKSTVSQQVLASFGADMVSVVMQDDYYRDQSDLTPEVRRKQNYDHPQAFDWPLPVRHVQALRNGEAPTARTTRRSISLPPRWRASSGSGSGPDRIA